LLSGLFTQLTDAFGRVGLVRNAMALGYSAAGRIVIQLIGVPVFTYFWGLHDYGTWLLLFTLPAFIAMGDIGLNFAASTAMIDAIERGEAQKAAEIFKALRSIMTGFALAVPAIGGIVLLVAPGVVGFASGPTDGKAVATVLLIAGYGLIGVQNTSTLAGFRSTGDYAKGILILETAGLVESAAALVVVAMGGGLFHAALAYFLIRSLVGIYAAVHLRAHAPVLFVKGKRHTGQVVRELFAPALASSAVPISNALTLQGSLAVLGAEVGPASVAVFATARTLVRLPLQLMMIAVNAALPLFTAASARDDRLRAKTLVNRTLTAAALVLVPSMLLLSVAGKSIVALWTNGVVQPTSITVPLLALAGLLNGAWLVLCNFVMALSRQAMFSYFYLAASVIMLGLTAVFAVWWGRPGAALAAVVLDAAMLFWVLRVARKLAIVTPDTLGEITSRERIRRGFAALRDRLRS
jgi:O-antigen/teichoic acid export membrane protein